MSLHRLNRMLFTFFEFYFCLKMVCKLFENSEVRITGVIIFDYVFKSLQTSCFASWSLGFANF